MYSARGEMEPFSSRKKAQAHILLAVRAVVSQIMSFLGNSVGQGQENEKNAGKNMFRSSENSVILGGLERGSGTPMGPRNTC